MGLANLCGGRMFCSSRATFREIGSIIIPLILKAGVPDDSLTHYYQTALPHLPLGKEGYQALRGLTEADYAEPWLHLVLHRRRNQWPDEIDYRPTIPNIFIGECSLPRFLTSKAATVASQVFDDLEAAYINEPEVLNDLKWLRTCKIRNLEEIFGSVLPMNFPPLLIAYVNFQIMNFAIPTDIHLKGFETLAKSALPRERHCNRRFKSFFAVKTALFSALREGRLGDASIVVERLKSTVDTILSSGDRVLCQGLIEILMEPTREREPSIKNLVRSVNELARVHRMVKEGKRTGKVYGTTLEALQFYNTAAEKVGRPISVRLFKKLAVKSKAEPRDFSLAPPSTYRRLFRRGSPPSVPVSYDKELESEYIKQSGRRIIENMFLEFGVRSVSVLEVELRDIIMTERFVGIVVPSSKGQKIKNCELPATWLWEADELQHLRDFIGWLKMRGFYDPNIRLTELAGFGRFEGKKSSDAAYKAIAKALKTSFHHEDTPAGLHIGRINLASWLPIRCLVAHHRWLLDEPILACCKNDPWFSSDALDRLMQLYPSECYSVLEVGRRILMQSSSREIATTYLRCIPILLKLWANPRLQKEM